MTRTPIQQNLFDEGVADATGGRPSSPPEQPDLARHYLAGYNSVTPEDKTPAKKAPATKKAPTRKAPAAKKPAAKKPAAKKAPAKKRSGRARPVARARRQIMAPIQTEFVSGIKVLAYMAGLAFGYNLMVNAKTTATAIDKLTGAVGWLDSTRPIPYKPK